jgi:uncharacterized membrane protein YhdT
MSAIQWWFELSCSMLLLAFILFAFWQGMKVRPRDDPPPPSAYI